MCDVLHDTRQPARDPLERLLAGELRCVEFCGPEVVVDAPRRGRVYLPGSFNPLHEGKGARQDGKNGRETGWEEQQGGMLGGREGGREGVVCQWPAPGRMP
jgi:hypothetical protein